MKVLLIGLLALGTSSSYADTCSASVNRGDGSAFVTSKKIKGSPDKTTLKCISFASSQLLELNGVEVKAVLRKGDESRVFSISELSEEN